MALKFRYASGTARMWRAAFLVLFVVVFGFTSDSVLADASEESDLMDTEETKAPRMSIESLFRNPFLLNDIPEGFTLADLGGASDGAGGPGDGKANISNEIVPIRNRKGPKDLIAQRAAQRQQKQKAEPRQEEDAPVIVKSRPASSPVAPRRSQQEKTANAEADGKGYKKGTFKPQPTKKLALTDGTKKKPLGWPFLSDFDSDTNLASILSSFERTRGASSAEVKDREEELSHKQKQGNIKNLREKLSRRQSSKISDRLAAPAPIQANRSPKSSRLRNSQKPSQPNPVAQQQPNVARNPAPIRQQLRNRNQSQPRQPPSKANQIEVEPKAAPKVKEDGVIEEVSASGEFTLRRPRKQQAVVPPPKVRKQVDSPVPAKSQVPVKQKENQVAPAQNGFEYVYDYEEYYDELEASKENLAQPPGLLSRRADLSGDYIILTQNGAEVVQSTRAPTSTTTKAPEPQRPPSTPTRRDSRANILRSRHSPAPAVRETVSEPRSSQSASNSNAANNSFESKAYTRLRNRPNRAPDATQLNTIPSVHKTEFKDPAGARGQLQGSPSNQRTQTAPKQQRTRGSSIGFTRSDMGKHMSSAQDKQKSAEVGDSLSAESRTLPEENGEKTPEPVSQPTFTRTRGNRAQIIRSSGRTSAEVTTKAASSSVEVVSAPQPSRQARQRRPVNRPARPALGEPVSNEAAPKASPATPQRTRIRQPRPPPQQPIDNPSNEEDLQSVSSTTAASTRRRPTRPPRIVGQDGVVTRPRASLSISESIRNFGEIRTAGVKLNPIDGSIPAPNRTRVRGSRGPANANPTIVNQLRSRSRAPVGAPAAPPQPSPSSAEDKTSAERSRFRRPTPPPTTTTSLAQNSSELEEDTPTGTTLTPIQTSSTPLPTTRTSSRLDDIDDSLELERQKPVSIAEQNAKILENLAKLSLPPEATEAFLSSILGATEAPAPVKKQDLALDEPLEDEDDPTLNVTVSEDKFVIHRPRTEESAQTGKTLNRGQGVLRRKTPIGTVIAAATTTPTAPIQRTRGPSRPPVSQQARTTKQPVVNRRIVDRVRGRTGLTRGSISTPAPTPEADGSEGVGEDEGTANAAPFPQYVTLNRIRAQATENPESLEPENDEDLEQAGVGPKATAIPDSVTEGALSEEDPTEPAIQSDLTRPESGRSQPPITTWNPLGALERFRPEQGDSLSDFLPPRPPQQQPQQNFRPSEPFPIDVNSAGIPPRAEFRPRQFSLPRPDANGVLRFGGAASPFSPPPGSVPLAASGAFPSGNPSPFFRRSPQSPSPN